MVSGSPTGTGPWHVDRHYYVVAVLDHWRGFAAGRDWSAYGHTFYGHSCLHDGKKPDYLVKRLDQRVGFELSPQLNEIGSPNSL